MAPVPSKRYLDFLTLFEQKVSEAQASIRAMDRMMKPYDLVREALAEVNLPNAITLDIDKNGVWVSTIPVDNDTQKTFYPLINTIAAKLEAAKLHDGKPAISKSYWFHDYVWRLLSFYPYITVRFRIDIPFEGTNLIEVIRKEVPVPDHVQTDWSVVWHDKPYADQYKPYTAQDIPF